MLPATPIPPSLTFEPVRRVRLGDLTGDDVAHLFGGTTPLVVEGLDETWPDFMKSERIRDVVQFREARPNSVYVDGNQVFGVDNDSFLDAVEANRNVRVFGVRMVPEFDEALRSPGWLFDTLREKNTFRYHDKKALYFIGGGGAITPLHYDFEGNINWHIVIAGERPVYLWTYEQSGRLFKLPVVGFSLISVSGGWIDHRLARGYATVLKKGDLLFMPSSCWHQIEYPTPSMAATFSFHESEADRVRGTAVGHFWRGFMSLGQAVFRRRAIALATVPLLAPFLAYAALYIPANLAASVLPGRARRAATAAVGATERVIFRLYRPLMEYYRTKMWVGY